jgi:1-aminocyclopropane-1-carboxylate deaminase/D-cysteine desulfhydrase-like pyridoxal-dependent ACC family enzyme
VTDPTLRRQLRELLDRQPRYPISLLPTPLMPVPNFSTAVGGARIFIKRDDMTGLAYGGNKARKLDYFIGEAKAQGCDVFIGGGGAIQSNHALMCAAAARRAGMKPVIFARAGTRHYELQGDYLLTKILVDDAVYLFDTQEAAGAGRQGMQLADYMNQVAETLRAQGYKPYVLPGSGQPSGSLGYVECALELAEQCEALGIQPDWVFLTSTGGGQAGLLVGTAFLQQPHQIVGCSPYSSGSDAERAGRVADLANRTAKLLGAEVRIDPARVINLDYSGGAYGVPSPAGIEALQLLAQTEGIFLDPVYTSKGVACMIDQVRQGRIGAGETVIYIHTGGGPLNFVYNTELAQALDLSLESDQAVVVM